jgi:hypothetical protein
MSQSDTTPQPLETALRKTEADTEASLKAAAAVTRSLKRVRTVLRDGNVRELAAALAAVEQTMQALQQQVAMTGSRWDFDEAGYFASGGYTRELLATAQRLGLDIFEQDDRLYCYPSLVRVLPGERALLIDRGRERRLRPSLVVEHLRSLHERAPRFKPADFLASLFNAYRVLAQRHGSDALERGPVERLTQVYELLTLLPGQSRDYSRQEFARDLYLLDRSGLTETKDHFVVSFPASTGTKSSSGVITAITETGQERQYWGIAFNRGDHGQSQ